MRTVKIRRIGNSLGATLPREVLERLKAGEGDTVFLTETRDGFELTPYNPEFGASLKAFERTRKKYRNALRELAK
jgi:putative addiction module antidote